MGWENNVDDCISYQFPKILENYINNSNISGMMRFSHTDLKILQQLATGTTDIKTIAFNLKKSDKQIYASTKTLTTKNILKLINGRLEPNKMPHITLLLRLLQKHPNLTTILSGSGLLILCFLTTPKTITNLIRETNISKTTVYDTLQRCLKISAVKKKDGLYEINIDIWPDLQEFLTALTLYEKTTDPRVPANSTIYQKNSNEILFSNNSPLDATRTGFSVYEQYGIKLLLPTTYYYLPKKKLTKKDVFIHSLFITEKETDSRHLTYLSLFYLKFKNELPNIQHPLLGNIKRVLQGEHLKGYPSYKEIQEKAEVYDIRF